MAIIEWLEENFSNSALIPRESLQRARSRQLAEMVNSGIQPLVNLDIVRKISADPAEQMKWSAHWIRKGLAACELFIAKHQPKNASFCFGNELGLGDIFLIPQCYSAGRNEVPLADYPRISAIYESAKKTEAFQKSCPEIFAPK
jgi:maleylacetoacetate isomerase